MSIHLPSPIDPYVKAENSGDVEGLSECFAPNAIDQTKLVATNVSGTLLKGSGHWLIEEAPDQVIPAIVGFLK